MKSIHVNICVHLFGKIFAKNLEIFNENKILNILNQNFKNTVIKMPDKLNLFTRTVFIFINLHCFFRRNISK